jgi:RND family efflux transporter MFP subunit
MGVIGRFDTWQAKSGTRKRAVADPQTGASAPVASALVVLIALLSGCSTTQNVRAGGTAAESATTVGVTRVMRKPISRQLTLSSELVPFQEIDVYAKQSGYVRELKVDFGSRVEKGQLMATLEIPELETQLMQDAAAIKRDAEQVTRAKNQVASLEAQHKVYHLQAERMKGVVEKQPGLLAQQEIDNALGKDLEAEAQVEAGKSALEAAESQLEQTKAKEQQDRVLFDYSQIRAPFAGVVTQRYANLGALMQAGTNSSTQAMPLVRLSQDDIFRLVIPVPESYVKYIKVGDPVEVRVPSLDKTLPGKVARFSVDVNMDTRTMHTEVDVPNPSRVLIPGLYAEATLRLEHKSDALVVPLQAVNQNGQQATVLVAGPDNKIQERKITLGLQTASDTEVVAGLSAGDRVVVSDRSALKPGMDVKPQIVQLEQYQGGDQ